MARRLRINPPQRIYKHIQKLTTPSNPCSVVIISQSYILGQTLTRIASILAQNVEPVLFVFSKADAVKLSPRALDSIEC